MRDEVTNMHHKVLRVQLGRSEFSLAHGHGQLPLDGGHLTLHIVMGQVKMAVDVIVSNLRGARLSHPLK